MIKKKKKEFQLILILFDLSALGTFFQISTVEDEYSSLLSP